MRTANEYSKRQWKISCHGFGAPGRQWLRNELQPLVDEVLSAISVRVRGLFDEKQVRRLIEHDRSGKVDGAYTILSLVSIELWCRRFIDKPVPTP